MIPKQSVSGTRLRLTAAMLFMMSVASIPAIARAQRPSGASLPRGKMVGLMNTGRTFATATTLASGAVLITGGIDSNFNYLSTAELYNPATQRFTRLHPMTTARANHTATLLSNGQVLIAGGVVCGGGQCEELSSAEVYDPDLQRFFPVGNMFNSRTSHTATLLANGTVLLAGGSNGSGLSSAELYDPASGRFAETGSMISPRFAHTATLLNDGEVLIAGGRACEGDCSDNSAANTAEVYDPGRRQFFAAGTLVHGRLQHSATLLQDGRVLLTGGRSCTGDCEGDKTLADAEIYEPGTGTFTPAGSMSDSRASHQAVALPDGQVFVYGGSSEDERNGYHFLDSGEVFQTGTATFTSAGNGSVGGADLIAALMANQQVLIAGGLVGESVTRTAEVFSFSSN